MLLANTSLYLSSEREEQLSYITWMLGSHASSLPAQSEHQGRRFSRYALCLDKSMADNLCSGGYECMTHKRKQCDFTGMPGDGHFKKTTHIFHM